MALIDRAGERRLAEQETENLIRGRGLASEREIGASGLVTGGSRSRFASSVPRLAESLASRTGMQDSGAAAAAVNPFVEDLKRTDDEANSLRRVREKRDNVNRVFSFMSDRLASAGVDRQKAEEVAMQFALDEDRREDITNQNARSRDLAVKKQDLLDQYADRQLEMKRKALEDQKKGMFKQAIYKSLFGLAGAGLGAALAAPTGGLSLAAGASLGAMGGGMTGDVVSKADYA